MMIIIYLKKGGCENNMNLNQTTSPVKPILTITLP